GLVKEIQDESDLDRLVEDMEIKHLQNLINPHFLFNTLNKLSKIPYLECAKLSSALIDSVATLLRHNPFEIVRSVTLNDEYEVVNRVILNDEVEVDKGYFHIQKVRFSERIQFVYRVDEKCLQMPIPRLTLQPLVEKVFIHGIEEREEGGVISIRIFDTDDAVV